MEGRIEAAEGADPEFPVPISISRVQVKTSRAKRFGLTWRKGKRDDSADIDEKEFLWMESRRPLVITPQQLQLDYGEDEALLIRNSFQEKGLSHLLGTLNWPGVGTRWREFLKWSCSEKPDTPAAALRGFGRYLGRVTTYRALALDQKALKTILDADCIFPSGQLRVSADALEEVINTKGIRTVCVARLFISQLSRLLGHDPSISLHDDWQTTSLIASGYAYGDKQVCLFELNCPKVESIGWTLQEVALQGGAVLGGSYDDHEPWFCFPAPAMSKGIWFDGRKQRTERYGLYGVPFLKKRLQQLYIFESREQLSEALSPFAERQAALYEESTKFT